MTRLEGSERLLKILRAEYADAVKRRGFYLTTDIRLAKKLNTSTGTISIYLRWLQSQKKINFETKDGTYFLITV
jgi:hypothetical protein